MWKLHFSDSWYRRQKNDHSQPESPIKKIYNRHHQSGERISWKTMYAGGFPQCIWSVYLKLVLKKLIFWRKNVKHKELYFYHFHSTSYAEASFFAPLWSVICGRCSDGYSNYFPNCEWIYSIQCNLFNYNIQNIEIFLQMFQLKRWTHQPRYTGLVLASLLIRRDCRIKTSLEKIITCTQIEA